MNVKCSKCGKMTENWWGGLCYTCTGALDKMTKARKRIAEQKRSRAEQATVKKAERQTAGVVYIIRSVTGNYKIGHTSNLMNRLRTFAVKLPFEVEVEHTIKCRDRFFTEKFLKRFFVARHVAGEWYALTERDIEYIKQIKEL